MHEAAVHGQPNIYALFLSACAGLLRRDGAFGFVTPRSWTNGSYFRATRRALRQTMAIDALHLFDSRQAHFQGDAVLQEALIVWGTAARAQADITVSTSHGLADLESATATVYPPSQVLGPAVDSPIVLPGSKSISRFGSGVVTLVDLGLRVLTGPVVGFRAREHLRCEGTATSVPMLWMPHVRRSRVDWPRRHRAQHIEANAKSAWMLLPSEPMVLLRRFSPKEDERRITAAPYEGQLPGGSIGLENHLNVIRGTTAPLSIAAVRGLSAWLNSRVAWLNSRVVDEHLRERLGSTQVNAVELRALPVPEIATLEQLGSSLAPCPSLDEIDREVDRIVNRGHHGVRDHRAA